MFVASALFALSIMMSAAFLSWMRRAHNLDRHDAQQNPSGKILRERQYTAFLFCSAAIIWSWLSCESLAKEPAGVSRQ